MKLFGGNGPTNGEDKEEEVNLNVFVFFTEVVAVEERGIHRG